MKMTCLLVEDDRDDQEFFVETLHAVSKKTGCYAVSNGVEALLMLREEGLRPDFIFTDINMPIMDGYEFIEILKSHGEFRDIPVVVYSSNYGIDHMIRLRELGVLAFYSKGRFQLLPEILRQYFGDRKFNSVR